MKNSIITEGSKIYDVETVETVMIDSLTMDTSSIETSTIFQLNGIKKEITIVDNNLQNGNHLMSSYYMTVNQTIDKLSLRGNTFSSTEIQQGGILLIENLIKEFTLESTVFSDLTVIEESVLFK